MQTYVGIYSFVYLSQVWFEHVKINKFFWAQISNYKKTNKTTYSILNLAYKAEKIITKLNAL
jgi:EAL domain-containing protein (putative c-di-GMP-specific phosphodiesterase class I)